MTQRISIPAGRKTKPTCNKYDYIIKKASQLKKKYCTSDPFAILEALGVHVRYSDNFTHLKAFYYIMLGIPYVVLNASLDRAELKTVAAHELGHHLLHRSLASETPLREIGFYDMKSGPEYEANLFASELLIDSSELAALLKEEPDYYKICSVMGIQSELMAFKINSLNKNGGNYRLPFALQSDFLANNKSAGRA